MGWSTLLVRPVSGCRGGCIGCPFGTLYSSIEVLSINILDKILGVLGDYRFDETTILCPHPFNHPKIEYVIKRIKLYTRRLYVFAPINTLDDIDKNILEYIDELALITPTKKDFTLNEYYIRSLISNGYDRLAIYIPFTGRETDVENSLSIIKTVKEYGLRVRIGEYLYSTNKYIDPARIFQKRGFETGLSYGYLYGYRASAVFVGKYAVTALSKPRDPICRKIYIDPFGRLWKCPLSREYVNVGEEEITINTIRKIMYSHCPIICSSTELVPRIEISLSTPNGKTISQDILLLLEVISQVKSFTMACKLLGYPPSTYLERIRSLEKELGVKLLITRRGGADRGFTVLSEEGEKILKKYRRYRDIVFEALLKNESLEFKLSR